MFPFCCLTSTLPFSIGAYLFPSISISAYSIIPISSNFGLIEFIHSCIIAFSAFVEWYGVAGICSALISGGWNNITLSCRFSGIFAFSFESSSAFDRVLSTIAPMFCFLLLFLLNFSVTIL